VTITVYDFSPDGSRLWQRQRRDTRPDEELRRITEEFRAHDWAEGTMPPSSSTPHGPRHPRTTRRKPPTTVAITATPRGPQHPPVWFVAVLVGCIALLAMVFAVTR
jgi:hypothetical protein